MPESAYDEAHSAISHLASIIAPWWMDESQVLVGMLTAAFDAGGDGARPVLTVAGFVSSASDWNNFSKLWSERIGRDNLKYFRASEAESGWGEFKQFREKTEVEQRKIRESLYADLMDIIQANTYRFFGCSILNAAFQQMSEELREKFNLTAYSVAGRTCEKEVREWILYDPDWRKTSAAVEIVFEQGDPGKGKIQKRLSDDHCISPIFRYKKDTTDKNGIFHYGFIPLQAADWLAYELSRATPELLAEKFECISDFRWPLRQFLRKPGVPGVFDVDSMNRFESNIELWKTLRNWWGSLKNDKLPENENSESETA